MNSLMPDRSTLNRDDSRRAEVARPTADGLVVCGGCNGYGVVHRLSAYKRRICEQCQGTGKRPPKPRREKLEPTS